MCGVAAELRFPEVSRESGRLELDRRLFGPQSEDALPHASRAHLLRPSLDPMRSVAGDARGVARASQGRRMIGLNQQLPSQALSMRPDRLTQCGRVLPKLSCKPGPEPAHALTSLDNLTAAELAAH